jgi:sRNA-binding carbon storage regulator CsrA
MALVFNRDLNERFFLILPDGRSISVRYCDTRSGTSIRLAVDAPPDIQIVRDDTKSDGRRYHGPADPRLANAGRLQVAAEGGR